jgi:hypothetical protein
MMMVIFYLFGSFERALATLKLYAVNNGHQEWTKTQVPQLIEEAHMLLKKGILGLLMIMVVFYLIGSLEREIERELCPH